jgi:hypothetical protein
VKRVAARSLLRDSAFANQAGPNDRDIARATGVAPRTARAWLAGTQRPTGAGARWLAEMAMLVERLAGIIDPSFLAVWLREPIPALNDDRPLDVIGRGDYRTKAGSVSALEQSPTT